MTIKRFDDGDRILIAFENLSPEEKKKLSKLIGYMFDSDFSEEDIKHVEPLKLEPESVPDTSNMVQTDLKDEVISVLDELEYIDESTSSYALIKDFLLKHENTIKPIVNHIIRASGFRSSTGYIDFIQTTSEDSVRGLFYQFKLEYTRK